METTTTKKPFVLFADDDQATLDLFKYYSDERQWDSDFVTTAPQILEKVNYFCAHVGHCYDLIVADVNYFNVGEKKPRITGITAAWEIRKSYPNIPIVFVSGFTNALLREQAREVGGEIVLKPLDYEALFDHLQKLIHWASSSCGECEDERRQRSINNTTNLRRKTDRILEMPEGIQSAILEVRALKQGGLR